MKVRREIASVPLRTAGETWQAIVDLITGDDSIDAGTLKAAASVMESLIVDEHPACCPIVVKGEGPRLVIYLLYNEAAMEAGKDIDPLTWNPTGGPAWQITAPSEAGDVGWMNNTLKSRAPRITVHDAAAAPADADEADDNASAQGQALKINWEVLDQP
jgi:hypothetical protein